MRKFRGSCKRVYRKVGALHADLMDADYSKSTVDVFRDLTEIVIQKSESLHMLSHVQHGQAISRPSLDSDMGE
jgi:hypothetical protein